MTEEPKKILADFLEALLGGSSGKNATMNAIHQCLDKDFVRAFDQWMKPQHEAAIANGSPLTVGAVLTSIAYIIATEIHRNCSTETEVCRAAQMYGDYIHDLAHTICEHHGVGKKSH